MATSILHIAHASEWDSAVKEGRYAWSSRGVTLDEEGFIHCSTRAQVAGVAQRFYADDPEPLVVLVISKAAVAASGIELRWEPAGGDLFPHVYGAIRPEWVTEMRPATFVDGQFVY